MAAAYPHFLVSETLTAAAAPPPMVTPATPLTQDELKKIAAYKAVEHVRSGMVLGLGTGSTAKHAVDRIAELLKQGKLNDVVGIATSTKTYEQAASLGIPLSDLDTHPIVDLSIDGADEVDPDLNLVKGRGGSLLREKMVESASKKFIVIVDETKLVRHIGGSGLAMPVEVIPFCWSHSLRRLAALFPDAGCVAKLRTGGGGEAYVSDNGNYIIDLYFEREIGDLKEASDRILRLPGIVEHGMFIGLASSVIVAGVNGVTVKTKKKGGELGIDSCWKWKATSAFLPSFCLFLIPHLILFWGSSALSHLFFFLFFFLLNQLIIVWRVSSNSIISLLQLRSNNSFSNNSSSVLALSILNTELLFQSTTHMKRQRTFRLRAINRASILRFANVALLLPSESTKNTSGT